MRKHVPFWLGILLLVCSVGARAQSVSKVLLVINDNSPTSIEIGNYYALKRGIPAVNICHINSLDGAPNNSAALNWVSFVETVRNPIQNYIATHALDIEYIVLTKGISPLVRGGAGNPLIASNGAANAEGVASTDGFLAVSRDYGDPDLIAENDAQTYVYFKSWVNRFWNSGHHFSRATDSGYLVTRLEGFSVASIKAMIDRSVEAAYLVGTWILDLSPEYGFYAAHSHPWGINAADYTGLRYLDFNWDIYEAADDLVAARIPGVRRIDGDVSFGSPNGTFEYDVPNIAGYIGWGGNDAARDVSGSYVLTRARWNTLSFLPGSIGDTAYSSSGINLNDRVNNNKAPIADFVDQGISGASGNVDEPYLDAISSPSVLFPHWINEYNLAETFYSAYRFIGWRQVVIGDPLTKVKVPRLIPLTEQIAADKTVLPLGTYQ